MGSKIHFESLQFAAAGWRCRQVLQCCNPWQCSPHLTLSLTHSFTIILINQQVIKYYLYLTFLTKAMSAFSSSAVEPSVDEIKPYLTFNGTTRQALEFYRDSLGGKLDVMVSV